MPDMEQLLASGRAGDRFALAALIERYQGAVAELVMGLTHDTRECEPLCRSIFVEMVLGMGRPRSPGAFEAWLFAIAGQACREEVRRHRRRTP